MVGTRFQDPITEAVGALDDPAALSGVTLQVAVRPGRVVRDEEDVGARLLAPRAAADPLPERDFRLAVAGELHQADGRHIDADGGRADQHSTNEPLGQAPGAGRHCCWRTPKAMRA